MAAAPETGSYFVLRARPEAAAPAWWEAAAGRRRDAPPAIAVLLAGRSRVEVTLDEGNHALAWAGTVAGWAAADPKPLFLHQPAAS